MDAEYYGAMTLPSNAYKGPIYNLQALMKYCHRVSKEPDELTNEEKSLFEVRTNNAEKMTA